jgi:hypothetical protein
MAKQPRIRAPKNYAPVLLEMELADDRAAAIVAASLVETSLTLVIIKRLREPLDDVEIKRLFEGRGVLSTFEYKIDIGFALNLYDKLVRDDLHKIREIRNQFAHHLEVRNFDHTDVSGKCAQCIEIFSYSRVKAA